MMHAGTKAKISYSLGYTAPEVILAVEAGQRNMEASAALDIWAVGVVAFELLTRRRAFAPATQRTHVRSAALCCAALRVAQIPSKEQQQRAHHFYGLLHVCCIDREVCFDLRLLGVVGLSVLQGHVEFSVQRCVWNGAVVVQVFSAIAGRTPLPWEPGSAGDVEERLKPLRGLKRTILKCLSRDPAQRPSAAALIASWDHSFDDMQTKGCTDEKDPLNEHPLHHASGPGAAAAAMAARTRMESAARSSVAGAGTSAAAAAAGDSAMRGASHWRPHTAAASGSPAEDLSRMGSMLQSGPSSMQPTTSKAASGATPSHAPLWSGPSAQSPMSAHGAGVASRGAESMSSRAGSRAGTPAHAALSTAGTGSEWGSAGARSIVPALPNFNPERDPDDTTDRITTTGRITTDGVTTERSL